MSDLEKRIDVFGVKISNVNMDEAIIKIEEAIKIHKAHYVCISNVHTTVMSKQNEFFKNITNESYLSTPDGVPLVWYAKLTGNKKISRVAGPDLMDSLFKISEEKCYTHYFYGGSENTLEQLKKELENKYPRLKIVGMYSPPYRKLTPEEDNDIISIINKAKPNILWVGLGAPKQEFWMNDHKNRIKSSIMIGVGAGFDFFAGTIKRAPLWMQKSGLEWLFRLSQEPTRLWKRYFVTNSLFILYSIQDLVRKKVGK